MHRRKALQEKVDRLGELGPVVLVVNEKATRAKRARAYMDELCTEHPVFRRATHVLTSISLRQTIDNIRNAAPEEGAVRLIVPIGGDTTYNAAFAAAEGTNNVVVAMRAGNATNAAINLQKVGGKILKPHEVIDVGKIASVRGIEMRVDDKRHLAATFTDVGMLSRGAQALNTWIRDIPGYSDARIRDTFHERLLLVGYSALQPTIAVQGEWPDGSEIGPTTLGISVANARHIGHHAVFPTISMLEAGGFCFELANRRSMLDYAKRIQDGTLGGHTLGMGVQLQFTLGSDATASVDGQHFSVNSGQTIVQGISPDTVNVMFAESLSEAV